jgi:hypothetical protein
MPVLVGTAVLIVGSKPATSGTPAWLILKPSMAKP